MRNGPALENNRGFGERGQVLADGVVASAILRRLPLYATVGQSYRMRAHVRAAREGAAMLGGR